MTDPYEEKPWLTTPLIKSDRLSSRLGCDVYLKLETIQPSQSFKYRGISLFVQHVKATRGPNIHLIIASGGNAGLAAACAGKALGLSCTVYLPKGASKDMILRLAEQGSKVVEFGSNYLEASREAARTAADDPQAALIPAYDDPILWQGHGSLIEEIKMQLSCKPDAIVCSVGGGGLLGGLMDGCSRVDWDDVPLIALETTGSACFYYSLACNNTWGEGENLPSDAERTFDGESKVWLSYVQNHSKASSLAATSPSARVVRAALDRRGSVTCCTVPDEMAMSALSSFANDHKIIVELACSTALCPAYYPELFNRIIDIRGDKSEEISGKQVVVFIVCGGVKISFEELRDYSRAVEKALEQGSEWEVSCNGRRLGIRPGYLGK